MGVDASPARTHAHLHVPPHFLRLRRELSGTRWTVYGPVPPNVMSYVFVPCGFVAQRRPVTYKLKVSRMPNVEFKVEQVQQTPAVAAPLPQRPNASTASHRPQTATPRPRDQTTLNPHDMNRRLIYNRHGVRIVVSQMGAFGPRDFDATSVLMPHPRRCTLRSLAAAMAVSVRCRSQYPRLRPQRHFDWAPAPRSVPSTTYTPTCAALCGMVGFIQWLFLRRDRLLLHQRALHAARRRPWHARLLRLVRTLRMRARAVVRVLASLVTWPRTCSLVVECLVRGLGSPPRPLRSLW